LRSPLRYLSRGNTGAVSELVVCADLLKKGYEVFRSVSPSSSCDLIVLKDGKTLTIEVRTGCVNSDGTHRYSGRVKASVLAVVVMNLKDNSEVEMKVHYVPELSKSGIEK
jgi:Holliday junction resolvase-like predicted endonuclease